MVCTLRVVFISILSIAPLTALVPQDKDAASKAGPAAVEQTTPLPSFTRAISPFVPKSINRWLPSLFKIEEARTPAVISPPTWPAILAST